MKKKSLLLVFIISLLFGSVPISVSAETATYVIMPGNECIEIRRVNNSNTVYSFMIDSDTRAVGFYNTNGIQYWFISDSAFNYSNTVTSCPATATVPAGQQGNYYYTSQVIRVSQNVNLLEQIIPVISDVTSNISNAIYYTYGEGAVDPVEPINWGILKDVTYETAIAGNGSASVRNVDYIHWEPSIDALGNDISENTVEIRAVPGKWTGSDLQNLMQKVNTDLDTGSYGPVNLGTVNASVGTFSISWQRILNELGWNFDSMFAHLEDEVFLKQGWYYQIRMLADGYEGSWQTVYTALSGSAQGSENIINSNTYNTDIYQYMQDLTEINNQNNLNITINNTTYNIENPNNGTEPAEGTDLWDMLKVILSGIFQLLEAMGNIIASIVQAVGDIVAALVQAVADLLSGLLDLIHDLILPPEEISNDVNTEFNTNINNYIETGQPGLNTVHDTIEDLHETVESIGNSHSGSPACVLRWDGVTLDLSVFNAGNVTFIESGTFDLGSQFMSILEAFGMTYQTYQTLVSGAIYLSLIVLIGNKMKGFLSKT